MTEYPTRTEGLLLERDVNRSLRSLAHDLPATVLAAILPMLAELDDARDLREAIFRYADLSIADLYDTDLSGAFLTGAYYNASTVWPEGFDPTAAGAVLEDSE